jgi:hypothetical protein
VEKLRVVLAKRGVGVSASALTVGLVGLGGARASAGLVMSVSGAAVQKGVVSGSGMFSLGGILAGALGVSVVMGGVRLMARDEVEVRPVVESGRVLKAERGGSWRRVIEIRRGGERLSEDEIFAKLLELDDEPANVIRQSVIEYLLEGIAVDRVFTFLDRCHGEFSIFMEEKVFGDLLALAVKDLPAETMDELLSRGWFWRLRDIGNNLSVGKGGVAEWGQVDRFGAIEWFIRNWGEIDADGGSGGASWVGDFSRRRRGRSFFDQSYTAGEVYLADFAVHHWRVVGDEGLKEFVGNFSERQQVMVWKKVLKSRWAHGDLFPEEMAERLVGFSDEGIYGEMKEVVWRYWIQMARPLLKEGLSWDDTLEEYQKMLPEKYADDFQKACRDAVEPLVTKDENE